MLWNQKAIVADRKFYNRAGPMNFYSGYRVHNYHFAAYGAMFLGQYAPAIAAANELIETRPRKCCAFPHRRSPIFSGATLRSDSTTDPVR